MSTDDPDPHKGIPFCGKTSYGKNPKGQRQSRSLQDEIWEIHSIHKTSRTSSIESALDKNDSLETSSTRNESYDWKMSVGYLKAMEKLENMKQEMVKMHTDLADVSREFASMQQKVRLLKKHVVENKVETTEFYQEMEVEAYLSDMIRTLSRHGDNIQLEMYPLGLDVRRDMRMPPRDYWPKGVVGLRNDRAVLKSHSDTALQ